MVAAECLGSNVSENRICGAALCLAQQPPLLEQKLLGTGNIPFEFPLADALLAVRVF